MLTISNIMVSSDEPQKLADFYSEVLNKKADWVDEKNSFYGFAAGDCMISIGAHDKIKTQSQEPEGIIIFLQSDDVLKEFDRIKAIEGTGVVAEPYNPGEDKKMYLATLSDTDGNFFKLASPWQ